MRRTLCLIAAMAASSTAFAADRETQGNHYLPADKVPWVGEAGAPVQLGPFGETALRVKRHAVAHPARLPIRSPLTHCGLLGGRRARRMGTLGAIHGRRQRNPSGRRRTLDAGEDTAA